MADKLSTHLFGPCTLVIEWDGEHVAMLDHAAITNKSALEGVTFNRLAETPPERSRWGGIWISVSMPEPMFLKVLREYLDNDGTLDMSHCVQTYLYDLIPDEIIDARDSIPDGPEDF